MLLIDTDHLHQYQYQYHGFPYLNHSLSLSLSLPLMHPLPSVHIVPVPPSDSYSPNSPRALESHKKVVPTPASGSASQPVVSTVTGSGTVSTHVPPVPLSSEWEEALEKSLRNVLAEGNPVLLLFTKRVYKVLLRALLGQPYNAKLPSFSLHAKGIQKNLAELLGKATRLFSFHMSVYGEVYSMIFSSPTMQNYLFPIDVEVD